MTIFEHLLSAALLVQTPDVMERNGYKIICDGVMARTEQINEDTSYVMAKKVDSTEYGPLVGFSRGVSESDGIQPTAREVQLIRNASEEIFQHGEDYFILIFSNPDKISDSDTLYYAPEGKFVYGNKIKKYMENKGVCR